MKEKTILDAIGNTPIIKLQNITKNSGHDFYAKLEYLNPGGSYKDRIAKYILDKAIETGKLKKGGHYCRMHLRQYWSRHCNLGCCK